MSRHKPASKLCLLIRCNHNLTELLVPNAYDTLTTLITIKNIISKNSGVSGNTVVSSCR